MTPMGRVALGLVVVGLDLTWEGFDVIPDPLGWAVAAMALGELATRHRWFGVAARCAWAAALVSLVAWVPVWGSPPDVPWVLSTLTTLLDVAVVVLVCSAFVDLLAGPDPGAARQAAVIRWLDPVVAVTGLALTLWAVSTYPGAQPAGIDAGPLTPLALVLVVLGLGVRVWFLVLVLRGGDHLADPAARHPDAVRP